MFNWVVLLLFGVLVPIQLISAEEGFLDVIKTVPGLKHYYPLNKIYQARDVIGLLNGTVHGNVTFGTQARFDGNSYIEIPDHNDFSVSTKGALTILVFNTIDNWKGAGASEYVHWMGKGIPDAYEWVFRHYVLNGTGEASRQYRTSFYHFNLQGRLGAGSYFQDPDAPGTERMVTGMVNLTTISMWKNGQKRDSDPLSEYNIIPQNAGAPVRLGTRDMTSGFLVGRLRRVAFFDRLLTQVELQKLYDARNFSEIVVRSSTGASYPLTGFNVPRTTDALVAYTKVGPTGTNQFGTEVVVQNGQVVRVSQGQPGISVPLGVIVLSGHGKARQWLDANAKIGAHLVVPQE